MNTITVKNSLDRTMQIIQCLEDKESISVTAGQFCLKAKFIEIDLGTHLPCLPTISLLHTDNAKMN
jgi:hypothetical protein